jgi:Cytochrome c7 and related cytochrome c
VAPLEPWEKVLVNAETYPATVHGQIPCISCHNGIQDADKEIAHTGLVDNPSFSPEGVCGECHPDVVAHNELSLHTNLAGYWTVLDERSTPKNHAAISEAFGNHCSSCHASCGECHVSQPNLVGGGLIDGHLFSKSPSMTRNCTACHGSRIGNEYLGKHEGLLADVHFRQGRMDCIDCHTEAEMHGEPAECSTCHQGPEAQQIPPEDHRYSGVQNPSCEACHITAATGQDDVIFHQYHGGDLSCQVCHAIEYTSCDGCHLAISETTGNPFYQTEADYLTFLIGKNPLASFERPYKYVPVRHIPVDQETFAFYGENLLDEFNNLETWKYTTPHNIQLRTPQTESCNACHGNPDLFLTADKVKPEEFEANRDVIVDEIPVPLLSGEQFR